MGRICIIGAGLSGLAAAYDLGRAGNTVTVLESSAEIGGLASSLVIGGSPVERFYHFICRGDQDLIDLADELGLGGRLHWRQSRTSFYYDGQLYGFGTPLDLLAFRPVPILQRIRFGLNVGRSRYRRSWEELDGRSAREWLTEQIGARAYEVIWDPLLRVKFGDYHSDISAAWIWHRINRIASSRRFLWERERLGYLERGSETVIEALAARLRAMPGVDIRCSERTERILATEGRVTAVRVEGQPDPIPCDAVVSTVALGVLSRLAPDLDPTYLKRIGSIDYIGVVCGLLRLKRPLTDAFWTNINDRQIPFNGIIEYTNLNRHLREVLHGGAVVYIPYYLRSTSARYAYSDEQLYREFVDGMRRVNPSFDESWVEECHVSRTPHAQAICTVGFKALVPDHRTPLKGLFITDSTQYYPEDRTISAAIRLGRRVARMISAEGRTP